MYARLIGTSLVALSLGGAAAAQTTVWTDDMGRVFYSDDGMTTLRSDEEIRTNWGALTEDQRSSMMAECSAVGASTTLDGSDDSAITADSEATPTGGGNAPANATGEPVADTGTDAPAQTADSGATPTSGPNAPSQTEEVPDTGVEGTSFTAESEATPEGGDNAPVNSAMASNPSMSQACTVIGSM